MVTALGLWFLGFGVDVVHRNDRLEERGVVGSCGVGAAARQLAKRQLNARGWVAASRLQWQNISTDCTSQ